ncbi:hypothetical protein ADN00_14155 [Ornatilinea apprima]|uniref:DUF2029 domain-containing protein n=1 Tax=Ornatilinea apprima TaxID=1134406 RepID=A0A0P6WV54_9CHLR|nr:hypothetical protein [Ornatilinea apprima]KPL74139.1 hypothetical protein ADN00_14155 [Ornatilinea apprima]
MRLQFSSNKISNQARAAFGFALGLVLMLAVVQVFLVNHFDFDNMRRGTGLLLSGVNPWAPQTRIPHYYNPPFSVLFLWPLLFTTPHLMLVIGGALIFAVIFYQKTWAALAWFATNTFLWLVAAGGVDLYLIGAGLLLLFASDRAPRRWLQTALRVLGYGFLMVKPQGGLFICVFYALKRRDWAGVLVSGLLYGVLFAPLYPHWLRVLISDPPQAQNEASQSLLIQFGPWACAALAGLVLVSRRWKYWQIGGALAGILMPYGMPGIPALLTLSAAGNLAAAPAYVLFSAGLAWLTWTGIPTPQIMGIYHLGMIGLALVLACLLPAPEESDADTIDLRLTTLLKHARRWKNRRGLPTL